MTNLPKPIFGVQWHITTNCGNKCKHCYMYDSATYESERENTLQLSEMFLILDGLEEFENKWGADIRFFTITGGDPLLREDWKEFLIELKQRRKEVALAGNPETLTEDIASRLQEFGVSSFQMSLDGMESTHDAFRSEGSFGRTVEKLALLDKYGIYSNIMFTLFPRNAGDLIPLLRYVARNTPASSFSFDIGCSVGSASEMGESFEPDDLQALFSEFIKEKKELRKEYPIDIAEKSHLLKLTRFGNGEFYPFGSTKVPVAAGCIAGWSAVSILSDGTVLACRRMPLEAGKMPEQSFEDIFLGSEIMKRLRRQGSFEGCGTCDFYQVCRGCPAVVYGLTNDPFAENPLCFRSNISRQTDGSKEIPCPPLDTDNAHEYKLVADRYSAQLHALIGAFRDDKDLREVFMDIAYSRQKRDVFLSDPHRYLRETGKDLGEMEKIFLISCFCEAEVETPEGRTAGFIASAMLKKMIDELGM